MRSLSWSNELKKFRKKVLINWLKGARSLIYFFVKLKLCVFPHEKNQKREIHFLERPRFIQVSSKRERWKLDLALVWTAHGAPPPTTFSGEFAVAEPAPRRVIWRSLKTLDYCGGHTWTTKLVMSLTELSKARQELWNTDLISWNAAKVCNS